MIHRPQQRKLKKIDLENLSLKNIDSKKMSLTGEWFVKGMCHGQFWGEPCLSEQEIVLCEVTLEVIGYMYPGSGLQTGTGGSEFGLK